MKSILLFSLLPFLFASCQNAADTAAMQKDLDALTAQIEQMNAEKALPEVDEIGYVHVVYFWLKDGVTEAEKQQFMKNCEKMREIPEVLNLRVGIPAGTDREVVDNSYDVMLIVENADTAGQEAYQIADLHEVFRQENGDMFEKIVIYDSLLGG